MARVDRAGAMLLAGMMATVSGRQLDTATACCRYYSLWFVQLIVEFAFIRKHPLVNRILFCTVHINVMSSNYNVHATVVIFSVLDIVVLIQFYGVV